MPTNPEDLRIPERADQVPESDDLDLLRDLAERVRRQELSMVGFPVNLGFDYRHLADFLALHLNNAGSPGEASDYTLDSKPFEQAVVRFFAELAGGDPDATFGYVTHGGTEANLFAAYVGRERHPEAVLYASAEAHYAIPRISRVLRMPYVTVENNAEGAMDPDALRRELRSRPHLPALVIATVGTTGRGALDDVAAIRQLADEEGVTAFVHSDAAFGGLLAAFAQPPFPWGFPAGADSVMVTGHKMVGLPFPAGVVLARGSDVEMIRQPGAAVGSADDTLSGGRNALSPLMLWYALRRLGREGLARRVRYCLEVTDYAVRRLAEINQHPNRAPGGNVVLFDLPSLEVMREWTLLNENGRAHLVVMPHVTREHVDQLCAALRP
ncbi:histidine decarboxylase [Streptoalloteichus hindustanus]|uniref:L-histidine carboxy-lyase (Histamine-forming) n=1 Tax=Streptoalloteichus hindustanus TaxID=2017 RepID=A0A1M5CXV2_STRHI|nr:histidine decarboxylase [Streptoalloteichus hindustanus]SHF59484.1 L-histidine carboxy-lyase (histamine-forming) [Streptoalloteichus hindustanus]